MQLFGVRFGDTTVDLRELPSRAVQRIADTHKVDWLIVLTAPICDLEISADVIRAAAEHVGVDAPPLASAGEVIAAAEEHLVPLDKE